MANIEVKNIPEKLHNQLCRYARQQECTLGDFVLEAIERESLGGNGTGVSPPGRRPGLALQRRSCSMRNAGSVAVSYREPLRHRCVGSYEYLLRKPLGLILADILEDATLLAPELLDVEVMSVLRRAVLRGELFDQRAALALDDLTDWGVDRIPTCDCSAWHSNIETMSMPTTLLCSHGASRQRNPTNHRRPAFPRFLARNYRRKHQLAIVTIDGAAALFLNSVALHSGLRNQVVLRVGAETWALRNFNSQACMRYKNILSFDTA